MTNSASTSQADAWAAVEQEKRRDRFLKRVSTTAWTVTIGLVLVFGWITGVELAHTARAVAVGVMPPTAIGDQAMPFMLALMVLSALVGTLSTVGIFLRLRTASLAEIQLRLAALEDILTSRPDQPAGPRE